ncbi:MAG: hypothetical protein KJO53_03570, partial [Eudoraea sp.]|nr:hypothetical protein [Eudoraea sp.]
MKEHPYLYQFYTMIGLSLVMIYIVGTTRPQPMSSVIDKEKFWADKVHAKTKYNLIVAGDSRVYRGIAPRVISDELDGLKVLNFGFSSGGLNTEIFNEIEKRLARENKTIIVLGITPYSLTPRAQLNEHFKQEKERDRKEVFRRRFISPIIHFFDPIKPTDIIYAKDEQKGYYERFHKDGWVASLKIPIDSNAALKSYRKNFLENKVSKGVLHKLYKRVAEWKHEGFNIFAFRLPTTKAMLLLENEISGFNELDVIRNLKASG